MYKTHKYMLKKWLIILFLSICSFTFAQTTFQHRVGIGTNYVKKTYAEISTVVQHTTENWEFDAGLNWQGNVYYGSSIHAFSAGATYQLPLSQPLSVGIKYLYHPHNQLLISEQTLALSASYLPSHFDILVGTYIRFLNEKTNENQSVTEFGYFHYQFNVYVFPKNFTYNAMIGVRSFDTFDIEQTGNPMYVLNLTYRPSNIQYFLEGGIKPAGFFNIHVNPFHTQLRGGISWQL
jgi:hypothetical protein